MQKKIGQAILELTGDLNKSEIEPFRTNVAQSNFWGLAAVDYDKMGFNGATWTLEVLGGAAMGN